MTEPEQPATRQMTWTRDYPADWPDGLCEAALAEEFWKAMDLRHYRHFPRARTDIWAARRAASKAFKEMLAAHEKAQA